MNVRLQLTTALIVATSAPHEPLTNLPGAEDYSHNDSKIYTGFLEASPTRFLHYWFVESHHDIRNDPLLIWFNGGPGCSSLNGLLLGNGPFLLKNNGETLRRNPYSWSKVASVVYIESPVGVGFSFSTDGNLYNNDLQVARENYAAVKAFYNEFPEMRSNRLYLTGESYAGIYIPMLALEILAKNKEFYIPLEGLMIGNAWLNEQKGLDWIFRYAYTHGLISHKTWNELKATCFQHCTRHCSFAASTEDDCRNLVRNVRYNLMHTGINPYNINEDCNMDTKLSNTILKTSPLDLDTSMFARLWNETTEAVKSDPFILERYGPPCMKDKMLNNYVNQEAMRQALHLPSGIGDWTLCNHNVSAKYKKIMKDVSPLIRSIIEANIRILLYFGEADMLCNFMMGAEFAAELNLPAITDATIWHYNGRPAGWVTVYWGLTFVTVRGAGHMVAKTHPAQELHIIVQFLYKRPLEEQGPKWLLHDIDNDLHLFGHSEKLSYLHRETEAGFFSTPPDKTMIVITDRLSEIRSTGFDSLKVGNRLGRNIRICTVLQKYHGGELGGYH